MNTTRGTALLWKHSAGFLCMPPPSRLLAFCGVVATEYFKFLTLHQGYGTMLQSYSET